MSQSGKSFMVEDARLLFRNFSGKEGPFNRKGDRSFCVVVTPEVAEKLSSDGWNVKKLQSAEEGDDPTYHVQVAVNFSIRPPKIVMITSTGRTYLDESSVNVLDWADIKLADLIARSSNWNVNGKVGVKAYLQSLFVTIEEDALDLKYATYNEEPS